MSCSFKVPSDLTEAPIMISADNIPDKRRTNISRVAGTIYDRTYFYKNSDVLGQYRFAFVSEDQGKITVRIPIGYDEDDGFSVENIIAERSQNGDVEIHIRNSRLDDSDGGPHERIESQHPYDNTALSVRINFIINDYLAHKEALISGDVRHDPFPGGCINNTEQWAVIVDGHYQLFESKEAANDMLNKMCPGDITASMFSSAGIIEPGNKYGDTPRPITDIPPSNLHRVYDNEKLRRAMLTIISRPTPEFDMSSLIYEDYGEN